MKKVFLFLIVLMACIGLVSAFGIHSTYNENNPLRIAPGESIDTGIAMQNMVGDEDITLKAEITEGASIATITDASNQYTVPFGGYGSVNLRISIPQNDPIGKTYTVGVSLTTLTPGESGAVAMGQSIEKSFPVIVSSGEGAGEAEGGLSTSTIVILIIVIVVIVAALLWLILRKKKE